MRSCSTNRRNSGMKDKNRTIDKELEDLDTIAEITLLKIKYKPINAKNT